MSRVTPRMLAATLVLAAAGAGAPAIAESTSAPATAPATTAKAAKDYYAMSAEDFFKLPEVNRRITKDQIDIPLADAAVFHQTNLERVKNGMPTFTHSPAMERAAREHSEEMATMNYFSHTSPVESHATPEMRMEAAGAVGGGAENIHVRQALDVPSGRMLITVDANGNETRVDEKTKQPVGYYTYKRLAEGALESWMKSPGHRANILDKTWTLLGTGVARGPYDGGQDSLYFTQNFARKVKAE